MRRANCLAGAIAMAVTLTLLTTGCTRDESSAMASASSAENNLPEVVISARKAGADTVAMSQHNRDETAPTLAATVSPTRAHRQ